MVGAHYQKVKDFYPRPPRGERRKQTYDQLGRCAISIHALREESDRSRRIADCAPFAISIHALREESAQGVQAKAKKDAEFLSTPSARRATP